MCEAGGATVQWIRKEAQRWPRDRERDIRESRQRCKDNGSQNGRRQKPPICLQHVNGLPEVVVRY